MRRGRGNSRIRIFHVKRKKNVMRTVKVIIGQKLVALGIVLIFAGSTVLVYSLDHGVIINSPFIQQGQVEVNASSTASFLFGQPYNHILYLNISEPSNDSVNYSLYEMPAHQVAYISSDRNSFFMQELKQIQLPSQLLSNKTLVRTGSASGEVSIVLNNTKTILGQEFLLTLKSTSNVTFNAQISAYTNFQQVASSDWLTGISGSLIVLAGIFLIAVGISGVAKKLENV